LLNKKENSKKITTRGKLSRQGSLRDFLPSSALIRVVFARIGQGKDKGYILQPTRAQIHDHFEHTFSVIGPTGAEIEAFQNLFNVFNFSSLHELYKCAVFSGYNLSYSGYNLSGRNYNYNYRANYGANYSAIYSKNIRAILAELEIYGTNSLFSYELYKCAVEHKCAVFSGYNLSYSGYNLSGRKYDYINIINIKVSTDELIQSLFQSIFCFHFFSNSSQATPQGKLGFHTSSVKFFEFLYLFK
jgi:hypothetical protein